MRSLHQGLLGVAFCATLAEAQQEPPRRLDLAPDSTRPLPFPAWRSNSVVRA